MKKLLLLTIITVLFAFTANAQRICDVSIVLDAPTSNTTMNCEDNYSLKYTITNNGPDDILTGDTLYFQDPEIDDTTKVWFIVATSDVAVNNSVVLWDSLTNISRTNILLNSSNEYVLAPFDDGTYQYFVWFTGFGDTTVVKDDDLSNNISVAGIEIDCTVSIFENNKKEATPLSIFPNPANSEISFKYNFTENSQNSTIRITDFTGRTVKVQELGKQVIGEKQYTIDITSLASGVYYVELITDNSRAINKITVISQ